MRPGGHSLAVDPFGRVLNEMDEQPGVQITRIHLPLVEEIREQLPLLKSR